MSALQIEHALLFIIYKVRSATVFDKIIPSIIPIIFNRFTNSSDFIIPNEFVTGNLCPCIKSFGHVKYLHAGLSDDCCILGFMTPTRIPKGRSSTAFNKFCRPPIVRPDSLNLSVNCLKRNDDTLTSKVGGLCCFVLPIMQHRCWNSRVRTDCFPVMAVQKIMLSFKYTRIKPASYSISAI